jgi:hypothetical protein
MLWVARIGPGTDAVQNAKVVVMSSLMENKINSGRKTLSP